MHHYEYIIAGAGLAGLSLAWYLTEEGLGDQHILLIDRIDKKDNDRTWCFWAKDPHPFESIVYKRWDRLDFHASNTYRSESILPWTYQQINSSDFYHFIKCQINKHPNVHWLKEEIVQVNEDLRSPFVKTISRTIRGQWVFDSTLSVREKCKKEEKQRLGYI